MASDSTTEDSEEHTVSFAPKLGEVDFRRCRGNEPETVSGARFCCHCDLNACRGFEEIARKTIYRVSKADDAPSDTTPLDIQGFDHSTYNISQRASGSEAVLHRENIEH
jgi:hypothetical protein